MNRVLYDGAETWAAEVRAAEARAAKVWVRYPSRLRQ